MTEKATMQALARLVPEGSRVLDLGCGDGSMLDYLQRERGCSGYGIELADANVLACVRRGVNVIQLNLDEGLALFGDERLLRTPELLEQPQWAAESAAWFWSVNGLNTLADQEQFNTITRRINGGLNGLEERLQLWARARAVLCVSST